MSHNPWAHLVTHAAHEKNSKVSGIILIVVGFFLAPFLFGIPIMIYGFYKLCK